MGLQSFGLRFPLVHPYSVRFDPLRIEDQAALGQGG